MTAENDRRHKKSRRSPRRTAAKNVALLSDLIANLDTGVAVASSDGILLYANQRFSEMIGANARQNLEGINIRDFVVSRSWQDLGYALQRAGTSPIQGDVTLDLSGRTRTVRLVFSPITANGHRIRITASEVTELVETAKALQSSQVSLQSLSARILQVEDEERRRIARDLHDNTGQEIAALSMTLRQVEAHSQDLDAHARQSISDALTFASKIEIQIRTLSYLLHPPLLDELGLRAAIDWFVSGFQERSGIQLTVDIPEPLLRFSLREEIVLFRVLQSSLANVLRHSGSSTAHVRIRLSRGHIKLFIEDQGKGMSLSQLQAARQGLSTGIGIGGMRERLRELGGTLEVNSGRGGTQIIASLPFESKDQTAETPPQGFQGPLPAPIVANRSAEAENGRTRVLIADDHEITRQGIRSLLSAQTDLEVVGEAADGVEAITKAEELKPDLVIMDLTMPRLGGLAAATRIRESGSSSKILVFTTHSFPGLQRALRAAGCQGYILKEHASTDLARGIQEVLHGAEFYCPQAS